MSSKKYFIKPEDVETQVFDWGMIKWLSCPDVTGAEDASFGIVIIWPGKGHMRHNHPGREELIYVISGKGEQLVSPTKEPSEKDVRAELEPGMLVYIPRGYYHETINKGWDPMVALVIYTPPGPEKDIRALAEKVLPPGETPKF